MKKRLAITAIVLSLAALLAVGASFAYIFVDTKPVKNTFTYGDIDIDLWESQLKADGTLDKDVKLSAKTEEKTQSGYKMIPGSTIAKDPQVAVLKGSEACWLFIKIDESANFKDFMSYEIAEGWIPLADTDNNGIADNGVYYREVYAPTSSDAEFSVLKGDKVAVLNTVTKAMLNDSSFTNPTLTFTAYAVQRANIDTAEGAWAIAIPVS